THALTASYAGDSGFLPSASAVLNQKVTLFPPFPAAVTPNQKYVTQLYRDRLQRDPDLAGLNFFSTLLDQGQVNRFQVALAIETSTEARILQVQALYARYLGRPADTGGQASGIQFLQGGGRQEQLAAFLLGSPEYFLVRGGGTNAGFLNAVYHDVL